MVNEFYDAGEQRAAKVHNLFTRIAPRYDLINDLQSFGLHRYWKRRVIRLAQVRRGERVLDVCCGTGDLTLHLAQLGAHAMGADFTAGMLEVAKHRVRKLEGGSLSWMQADALSLPFADGSFDVVTVAYGLRNLSDVNSGLSEMKRVAKPGGRILVLDFGKPDNAAWRNLYFAYLGLFVPMLGRVFCGSTSAYAYILESLKNYPAQNGVAARMRDLDLTNLKILNFLGGVMSINYGEKRL
jgi:demethylmenaquinone methyltransferase / 2-methoxy-6-polyprenyl-1,4-benzoquinol methylase